MKHIELCFWVTELTIERPIQAAQAVEWGTPGVWHARAGTARERVCLGHWRASFDAAAGRRWGVGRVRFRTAASGGNSDIPRDFMKVSVAA